MADKLTIKQEKFAQGLFAGLSQREAYKQAYDAQNMTDKSIDEKACELANSVKVAERLNELTEELKQRNMVTVERVLSELSKIGFADIKDYLRFGMKDIVVGVDEEGKPVIVPKQVIEMKESEDVDGTMINEVSINAKGVFTFKLHDKMAALEKMGKYLGMFKDNVNLTGSIPVKIVDDID